MKDFHKILKALRDEKEMSQAQLGEALGYKSHSMIAQWESGKIFPTIESLITLADFFRVSIDYLIGREQ